MQFTICDAWIKSTKWQQHFKCFVITYIVAMKAPFVTESHNRRLSAPSGLYLNLQYQWQWYIHVQGQMRRTCHFDEYVHTYPCWGVLPPYGSLITQYDNVLKWKHFPRYWPFVRGIHRSPVTRNLDIFFDLRLNKQSWGWWFQTAFCPLWCHCNVHVICLSMCWVAFTVFGILRCSSSESRNILGPSSTTRGYNCIA